MSDKDSATPRVFLIRHGETEWSRNGRYTGITDLPLLPAGEAKVQQTASVVVGKGKLIDPARLLKVFCSPRQRAQRTLELLLPTDASPTVDISVTEDIREWSYGDYEGLKTHEILELRKSRGHDADGHKWTMWADGSEGPGSESPADVTARLDGLIDQICSLHGGYLAVLKQGGMKGLEEKYHGQRDILVVAHGHILRAFVKRWLGLALDFSIELMLEPGGVCGLSYAHGKINERAVLCGMSFPSGG